MNWEYKAMVIGVKAYEDLETVNKLLNIQSDWELVSVDNGVAYFKREVKLDPWYESTEASVFE